MAYRRAADPGTEKPGGGSKEAAAEKDPAASARDICLRLLTARPRSRAELATALGRKGIEPDVADRVLGRLSDVGLIDDTAFAEMVVQSGHRHRLMGRRALSAELRRRGVADETAVEAVSAIDSDDEEQAAHRLVERKLRAMSGLDDPTRIRRLVGMLARRGYSEGLAYRVVREALREHGSSAELPDPEHVT
ncbi:MAG TPA: regulatory protein RecX [Pseudonocardia sp.]|nr:regulatory protein RecX [Pseudonocardia sp.]